MNSDNFCDRLYVGGFSTTLSSEQIKNLINQAASPFDVTVEIVENGSRKHRGFAFVQCRAAAEANLLLTKFSALFTKVNFAKREPKPAENVMSNISNVFVRGVSRDMSDTELHRAFGGVADGVVQCHVADGYGFVLFDTRENAQKKIRQMDGTVLNGKPISVSWARPDTVGRKRKRPASEESPSLLNGGIASATLPISDFSNFSSMLKRPVIGTPQLLNPQILQFPMLAPPLFYPTNPAILAPPTSDLTPFFNFLI